MRLLDQTRLSDPGFAENQHDLTQALARSTQPRAEDVQLLLSSNERR
jgi:hypothetical protein